VLHASRRFARLTAEPEAHRGASKTRTMATLSPQTQQRIQKQVHEMVTTMSPASVGIELALAIVLGLVIGWWIDGQLGTSPIFCLIFLGFGACAGFRAVWRAAIKAMPPQEHK
jgi:ATP synthase protein I